MSSYLLQLPSSVKKLVSRFSTTGLLLAPRLMTIGRLMKNLAVEVTLRLCLATLHVMYSCLIVIISILLTPLFFFYPPEKVATLNWVIWLDEKSQHISYWIDRIGGM